MKFVSWNITIFLLVIAPAQAQQAASSARKTVNLPTSKRLLTPVLGAPQLTNSMPVTAALSPDGKYLALLNNGWGTAISDYAQSISILDLTTNQLRDFPDVRLKHSLRQTYFLGLVFSPDGSHLYASIASKSDPLGTGKGSLGNGIAVYKFAAGSVSPESFLKIAPEPLPPNRGRGLIANKLPAGHSIPYPAGLAMAKVSDRELLLVANNMADSVLLLDPQSGEIVKRFDVSTEKDVPGAYPYSVIATHDGRAFVSLWNSSRVAELDLAKGTTTRFIDLLRPAEKTAAGSHPTGLLLGPDEKVLYVTLSNRDRVAAISPQGNAPPRFFDVKLRGQEHGGSYPNALAVSPDGKHLYVAAAGLNAIAVFSTALTAGSRAAQPIGFIPTEWYPTTVTAAGDQLLVATGKGKGTGPNLNTQGQTSEAIREGHVYLVPLLYGSLARIDLHQSMARLAALTRDAESANLLGAGLVHSSLPASAAQAIKHVIYIIKENRTFDQVFGDLGAGNGDPRYCMFGEDITPNLHQLARQFGVLDNFYVSGEVSGDGHVWSTAAITSDYTEKTWQISYRGKERDYDYEGLVSGQVPLIGSQPDVNEPGTGYLWTNLAKHGKTYRHYGEYVDTEFCAKEEDAENPSEGTPISQAAYCHGASVIRRGELLPEHLGGGASPYPWPVPVVGRNIPTKPELRGHFDPFFADFNLGYPDQLRATEFLREFGQFVDARNKGAADQLPQFIVMRLPNDHTSGKKVAMPTPAAALADNDLAVGRVVEAVSHSPYWQDTAIFIVEDDAQDGPDHVDGHRSPALVISRFSPRAGNKPYVDPSFYTTVNMIHTMETLVGLPPMNHNDAYAPLMAPLFKGSGDQPAFSADPKNRDNGLIYQVNAARAKGSAASALMDFSHADGADTAALNAILWKDRMGSAPMPATRHAGALHGSAIHVKN